MDRPENAAGLNHIEGDIPDELKHLSDEELQTDFWDSPTCQRCLSYFHPELAEPVHNEPQTPAIHVPKGFVALQNSPANLATGLSAGCWWCTRLFASIQEAYGAMTIEYLSQRYPNFYSIIQRQNGYFLVYFLDEQKTYTMCFDRRDWTHSPRGYFIDNKEYAHPRQLTDKYLPSCIYQLSAVDSNTGSHRSMQYIATQIHNCRETHGECGQSSHSTWYPRRLLQILSAGDGSITSLRVVETRDNAAVNGPYATLSYCWGGKLNLRLLTDNYDSFCDEGIPAVKVPQLFLDAAFVTLKFRASFIWIDALCIIQDSTNDWLQESATMHRVYENGLCNIMAASATHSGEPLFRKRDIRLIAPCIIRGRDFRMISTYSNDKDLLEREEWTNILIRALLFQRGWVLQERLLATRNIIFTRDQIYFQCTEGTTRDIFPRNTCCEMGPLTLLYTSPRNFTYENCFQLWKNIVTTYGQTTLSYEKDTLIAVAGLAQKIKQLHPSRYLSGLWEADLVKGLCWMDRGRERRVGFGAPSWSWASVRYPTYIPFDSDYDIPKVLATTSEDKLQLRGPMFPISTDAPASPFDGARIEEAIRQRMGSLWASSSPISAYLDGPKAEREEQPLPKTLLCLPLLYSKDRFCTVVLLAPVTAAWGVYRRVGIFQMRFKDTTESPNLDASESEVRLEPLMAVCTRLPGDIHNHEYDQFTKEHTIFLV